MSVTDAAGLREISGEIHDWFFEIDDIALDADRGELVVPFRRWDESQATRVAAKPAGGMSLSQGLKRLVRAVEWEAPWYRWYLRVHAAQSYRIIDKAQIGGADFSGVSYDQSRQLIVIEGNFPVRIEVDVSRCEVSVEETGELLGMARFTRVGGGLAYSGDVLDAAPPSAGH